MDKIPVFRSAECAPCDSATRAAIDRVCNSKWYVLGREVAAFEAEFAHYCGVARCVSLANGTDALEFAMRAVGVSAGSLVLLVANAGFYGSTAVRSIGAQPRYLDVDEPSLTLSLSALSQYGGPLPAALVVTHLYGQLCPAIREIVAWAGQRGVPVIEDCAQAHGALLGGRRAGSFGTVGCFSFYPTKNLGAFGDAGAIITDDEAIAARVMQLRQYGWATKYHNVLPGGRNSRLDEMQAAILRARLPWLDGWNAERRRIAQRYCTAFADLPLHLPHVDGDDYVGHLFVIRVAGRDAFREHLNDCFVATDVHYPLPDHLQTAYKCDQDAGVLPVTESTCKSVVTLPCFPGMTEEEIDRVINAVRSFFR